MEPESMQEWGVARTPNYPGAQIEMSEIQAEYVAWFNEHLRHM